VIGRAAGSLDDYKYSKAMTASGLVWDEETLAAYLKAPKKFVKGTKMAFAGLKKDRDLADIIAYLKAAN
jgi:cytochrome c